MVSFLNAAEWRDAEVVSALRKHYMVTLVRARPPSDALQAPWCCMMPQGEVITVENWVPAAKSKPLVKLAESAMRFTPKESEAVSLHRAERNVCALIRSEDSGCGPAKLRRCAESWVEKLGSAVSNDAAGNCMFEAPGQAFCQSWQDSDRRSHSQDGGGGKYDGL